MSYHEEMEQRQAKAHANYEMWRWIAVRMTGAWFAALLGTVWWWAAFDISPRVGMAMGVTLAATSLLVITAIGWTIWLRDEL